MSPGPTFERVYLALKQQIMAGAYQPGERLEPTALSADLAASITPVRDALHRLAGERLVRTPRHDGFSIPQPTEAALRDLYRFNGRLTVLALGGRPCDPLPGSDAAADDSPSPATEAARLFLAVAALSGSHEHHAAVSGMNDRLHRFRLVEASLIPDWQVELSQMGEALEAVDLATLRRSAQAYHRRREKLVPRLLEHIQRTP